MSIRQLLNIAIKPVKNPAKLKKLPGPHLSRAPNRQPRPAPEEELVEVVHPVQPIVAAENVDAVPVRPGAPRRTRPPARHVRRQLAVTSRHRIP